MKNKDKYETFNSLKEAFSLFCRGRSRQVYDCQRGFGCAPRVNGCTLCYEMWKDSDTEAEEREMREKEQRRLAIERRRDELARNYPGLEFYSIDDVQITDSMDYHLVTLTSIRVGNILDENGIKTLGQYLALTEDTLKSFKGMGKKSIAEILTAQDSIRRYRVDHA